MSRSRRLTLNAKKEIALRLSDAVFKDRRAEVRENDKQLALDLREAVLGNYESVLAQLPARYLGTPGDHSKRIWVSKRGASKGDVQSFLMPPQLSKGFPRGNAVVIVSAAICNRLVKRNKTIEQVETDFQNFYDTAYAAISAKSTASALIKSWPEIEEYVIEVVGTDAALPAPQLEPLNKLIAAIKK